MTVYETDVPGVGQKFEIEVGDGVRAVVLIHHDGRVELFRREHPDADSEKVFDLTSQEANYLGSVLEGAYFETVDMDQLSVPLATPSSSGSTARRTRPWRAGHSPSPTSGRIERLVARVRGSGGAAPAA